MRKIPNISRALWNLSLLMPNCRVFNTQTVSFSAPYLFQAERFSSKHFGMKLLWRDTRQPPVTLRNMAAITRVLL